MDYGLPWELNHALQPDRLLLLARVAVNTRSKAVEEANRDEGDTNWGIGCKAHERLGFALSKLASSGEYPWLAVVRDGLYFMPYIDGVPIRPYRGSPEEPPARHLSAARAAHDGAQRLFPFAQTITQLSGPWFWLMAIDTDVDGKPLALVFEQANDAGNTRNRWVAPLDASVSSFPVPLTPEREPTDLPPPDVMLPEEESAQEEKNPAEG